MAEIRWRYEGVIGRLEGHQPWQIFSAWLTPPSIRSSIFAVAACRITRRDSAIESPLQGGRRHAPPRFYSRRGRHGSQNAPAGRVGQRAWQQVARQASRWWRPQMRMRARYVLCRAENTCGGMPAGVCCGVVSAVEDYVALQCPGRGKMRASEAQTAFRKRAFYCVSCSTPPSRLIDVMSSERFVASGGMFHACHRNVLR